jgi:hypothetical protein
MKVLNSLRELVTVEIMLANGTLDSVNIQPRGRVTLPPGAKINPAKEKLYASYTKVITDVVAPTAKTEVSPKSTSGETSGTSSVSLTQSTK